MRRQYPENPSVPLFGGDDLGLSLDCRRVIDQHREFIDNNVVEGRLSARYNFKISHFNNTVLSSLFKRLHSYQTCGYKVAVSYGCIVEDRLEKDLVYYSASHNQRFIEVPRIINSTASKESFCRELEEVDIVRLLERPSSRWVLKCLTNIVFYITKLIDTPIGRPVNLPNYLLHSRWLISLTHSKQTGRAFTDNLCFFRCLSLKMGYSTRNLEMKSKSLFHHYADERGLDHDIVNFSGVKLEDLEDLSVIFGCGIYVFNLRADGHTDTIRRTLIDTDILYLNLHEGHFSYITNLDQFSNSFQCPKCTKVVKSYKALSRHLKTCKEGVTKMYQNGSYYLEQNIFEELECRGIDIPPPEKRSNTALANFDIECFLKRTPSVPDTDRTIFTREHELLSISVCSNVPGYENPKCFTRKSFVTSRSLVKAMYALLINISAAASAILRAELSEIILAVEALEDEKLSAKFDKYLDQLVVCSYNGSKYDMNVLKKDLIPIIQADDPNLFVIKRGSAYLTITSKNLRFLDVMFYIEAGCDLRTFLRAYGANAEKGYMFYEYMDTIERLEEKTFPSYTSFFSSLNQKNVLEADYISYNALLEEGFSVRKALEKLQLDDPPPSGPEIYNRLQTMFYANDWCIDDYVQYYNNGDVAPFIRALENLTEYYRIRGINPFKDAVSGKCII